MWELFGGLICGTASAATSTTTSTTTLATGNYYYTATGGSGWGPTTTCANAYQSQMVNRYLTSGLYNSQGSSNWDGYATRDWLAEQRRKQAKELASHADAAKDRARNLLLDNLTTEQRETFEKNGWFVVEGGKSKKRYRIGGKDGHVAANIEVLSGDEVSHRLCGHCHVAKAPLGDQLLAQKLMLEHAEDDFIQIANRHAA